MINHLEKPMNFYHILVKKGMLLILWACVAISATPPLFATQKPLTQTAQGTFSGDYVIYRDYSWKTPTWIGFLYYDDETYGAFIHTPDKNSTVSILFSGTAKGTSLSLTGQQIISPITPDDTLAVNYLMMLLPTLYEKRQFPRPKNEAFGTAVVQAHIEEFGGPVDLQFQSFVPLFHLASMKGTKKEPILELAEIGTIQGSTDAAFYGYSPVEPKTATAAFKADKKAQKERVSVSGITLSLDSQWKKIADNSFLCGNTAFLTVSSLALPPPENSNSLTQAEQLIRILTGSSQYAKILLPYTRVTGTPDTFTLTQSVYDVESKKVSKDIKRCIKNKNGTTTVVSLTVESSAYYAEQAYFDALF